MKLGNVKCNALVTEPFFDTRWAGSANICLYGRKRR